MSEEEQLVVWASSETRTDEERVLDDAASSILMLQHTEVFSTRTYSLRQRQKAEGVEVTNLRAEQKGVLPVTFMHHVSKVVEGRMSFYRVRICRSCSGLPTLTELGSFADVESALLVNDAHEITHGRTKQLHLLAKGDSDYFGWLSVRCRGATEDVPLNHVLGTRVLKSSNAKRKATLEMEGSPKALLHLALQSSSSGGHEEEEKQERQESPEPDPSASSLKDACLEAQPDKRRLRRAPSQPRPSARANFSNAAGFESVWGLAGAADSLQGLVGVLHACLDERPGSPEQTDVDTLISAIRHSNTPAAVILALLASLLCGDASAASPLFRRLRGVIPPDTAPLSCDLQHALVAAIAEARGAVDTCAYDKAYQLVWLMHNAAAYFDWTLRLCIFDSSTYADTAVLEMMLHGAYSLVDVRSGMLLKFLSVLADCIASKPVDEHSSAVLDVEKQSIAAVVNLHMVMLSAAYLALKACSDPLPLLSCARTCNGFLPRLLKHDTDPCILVMYLQRLLLCHSVLLSAEKRGQYGQGLRHVRREGVDAFFRGVLDAMQALGRRVVALSRISFYRLSALPLGPGMLGLYETLFCSYAALFAASVALGDERSTFLEDVGLTLGMSELLSLTHKCIDFVQQYTARLKCVVLYTHTMVAMHAFMDTSAASPDDLSHAASAHPELLEIRGKCALLLSESASRYLLAQLLLDYSNSSIAPKAIERC